MKFVLGWLAANALYYIGLLAYFICDRLGDSTPWANFWYPAYHNCMSWSCDVNDWGGCDVWRSVDETEA